MVEEKSCGIKPQRKLKESQIELILCKPQDSVAIKYLQSLWWYIYLLVNIWFGRHGKQPAIALITSQFKQ